MAIHIKKKNVGKFTAYKKRTGKTTEEALHSKDPHVRQMANFAHNAKKWKHPDGGEIESNPALFTTYRDIKHPLTDINFIDQLVARGYGERSALFNMTPEQRQALVPQGTNLSWEKVNSGTANQGKYKYYETISKQTGKELWKDGKRTMVPPSEYYTNNLPEYSLGGNILEGAGTGLGTLGTMAALGATGPLGWGIAAAMGLGKLIGGISGEAREKRQAITDANNARQDQQVNANAGWKGYMAMGGLTPYGTPVEVEDGEVMRDPNDGSMVEFNGPTHEEGGIDIVAKPGSQVFGNLKITEGKYKGMTYKDAASKIKRQIAQLEKLKNS